MSKETAKFYVYENTSARINLPKSIANIMGWENLDELVVDIEFLNGKKGLFIHKE